jgi:hypothetical protein
MTAQPTDSVSEPDRPARRASRGHRGFAGAMLAVGIVGLSFLLYIERPFSLASDMGYQALSARQYFDRYTPRFHSIRLVDTHDIARDVISPIIAWTPVYNALFLSALKAGLSVGTAARVMALLLSLVGALGWTRVVLLVGLRGRWKIFGIVVASLYCLRTGSVTISSTGDLIIYAVAPWLLVAASSLSVPLPSGSRKRLAVRTVILCLALGLVYWLKYTGIFLSIAILIALLIEQFRTVIRTRFLPSLVLMVPYGAAFVAPAIALKVYNYSRSGTDIIESSVPYSARRTPQRLLGLVIEAAYTTATVPFSAEKGVDRIARSPFTAPAWFMRVPGLMLLFLFFYLMLRGPSSWIRNVTVLSAAVPLVMFPLLSFAVGPRYTFTMGRSIGPYWILVELMVLRLLAERPPVRSPRLRFAWYALALTAVIQMTLFLWIPYMALQDNRVIAHSKTYQTASANLFDTDLSRFGTRDIVKNVESLVHGPNDVIVPAIYSDRTLGTDTMLEFAGSRLLPLSNFQGRGLSGSAYYSSEPFRSSAPLRIILLAPDPYNRADFRQSTEHIMSRFPQVRQWSPGPIDPNGRTWIWVGEIG